MTGGPSALRRSRMGHLHRAGQSDGRRLLAQLTGRQSKREIARPVTNGRRRSRYGGIGPTMLERLWLRILSKTLAR